MSQCLQRRKTSRLLGPHTLWITILLACWIARSNAFPTVEFLRKLSVTKNAVDQKKNIVVGPWKNFNYVSKSQQQQQRQCFVELCSKKNDEDKDNISFPFLTVALPLVGIVALWPLLALLRDTNDPTSGFDIDMFMALKGILDSSSDVHDNILELPPLSPAERLVDAIFGPP